MVVSIFANTRKCSFQTPGPKAWISVREGNPSASGTCRWHVTHPGDIPKPPSFGLTRWVENHKDLQLSSCEATLFYGTACLIWLSWVFIPEYGTTQLHVVAYGISSGCSGAARVGSWKHRCIDVYGLWMSLCIYL